MRLEAGKRYVTRSGLWTTPLYDRIVPSEFKFGAWVGSNVYTWREDGRHSEVEDSPIDLVRQLDKAPPGCEGPVSGDVTGPDTPAGVGEGRKDDGGKPRYDLIAPEFLDEVAQVLALGAAKYAPRNWEHGMSWGRCFGAMMRHMWAWWRGEEKDPETGLSHLAHAGCNVMFLCAYSKRSVGTDDRWREPRK